MSHDTGVGVLTASPLKSSKPAGSNPAGVWYLCQMELSGERPKTSMRLGPQEFAAMGESLDAVAVWCGQYVCTSVVRSKGLTVAANRPVNIEVSILRANEAFGRWESN